MCDTNSVKEFSVCRSPEIFIDFLFICESKLPPIDTFSDPFIMLYPYVCTNVPYVCANVQHFSWMWTNSIYGCYLANQYKLELWKLCNIIFFHTCNQSTLAISTLFSEIMIEVATRNWCQFFKFFHRLVT